MNKMFAHQIGRNVHVYVDDMLVKSLHEVDHLDDLRETFDTLRLGLSIQSEDPTHPKIPTGSDRKTGRPDQVTGRQRVICSKNRLWRVGLGFPPQNRKKPDPTDVLRFPSKNFQNSVEVSRIQRYFLEFGLKFPDSGLKFPNSGNKLSYFGDLSSRSSDISSKSSEISPDLARSH